VLEEYAPEIAEDDVTALGLNSPTEALLYGIVTLRGEGRATVNLKGPIVINANTGVGKQVVLVNVSEYPLNHSIGRPD
jgi:flagellar assembly factor FliW